MSNDYQKAKELGLVGKDRWEECIRHHPTSIRMMKFISADDAYNYGDYFDWRYGGDGDNGETLMYQMDAFFELLDKLNSSENDVDSSLIQQ